MALPTRDLDSDLGHMFSIVTAQYNLIYKIHDVLTRTLEKLRNAVGPDIEGDSSAGSITDAVPKASRRMLRVSRAINTEAGNFAGLANMA